MGSLGSGELFDAPKGPPPAKPILAAAIKASEQAKAAQAAQASTAESRTGAHLQDPNQLIIEHESDGDSLGSGELFDAPRGPRPAKPLPAAAIKAREQAEVAAKVVPEVAKPAESSSSDESSGISSRKSGYESESEDDKDDKDTDAGTKAKAAIEISGLFLRVLRSCVHDVAIN
jgi:hypothetical protein